MKVKVAILTAYLKEEQQNIQSDRFVQFSIAV